MIWLWRHPVIRTIALLMGGLVFVDDGMRLIIIVLAQHQGASSLTIGLIFGIGGIGGIVGALLGALVQRRLSFGKVIIGAFWAFALIWPLYALAPSPLSSGSSWPVSGWSMKSMMWCRSATGERRSRMPCRGESIALTGW